MITALELFRSGTTVTVTATSDLAADGVTVYYFWYKDGGFVGSSIVSSRDFFVAPGEQVEVDCVDSLDPNWDPIANAPAGYPARRSLYWTRSQDADTEAYRIEQKRGTDDEVVIGTQAQDGDQWQFTFDTPRLDDGATYGWDIVPVDAAGNDGTSISLGEDVVRTPDAPNYTVTLESDTTLTFSEVT